MRYKAVFFDRDNTLTYFNPRKKACMWMTTSRRPTVRGRRALPLLIDRSGNTGGRWTITSLRQMIDFVENMD